MNLGATLESQETLRQCECTGGSCQVTLHVSRYIMLSGQIPTLFVLFFLVILANKVPCRHKLLFKANIFSHQNSTGRSQGLITCCEMYGLLVDEELKSSLAPIEQAVLLAMGEQYNHTTAKDEMQTWQIVPFANAVLSQGKTTYILQLAAALSR